MSNNINFLEETINALEKNGVEIVPEDIAVMHRADGSINNWDWFSKKANFTYLNKGGSIIISRGLEILVRNKGYLTRYSDIKTGYECWVWNSDSTVDFQTKDHPVPICYW